MIFMVEALWAALAVLEDEEMNILLATLGSYGDVFPMVGIAARLVQRGHTVALFTNEHTGRWPASMGMLGGKGMAQARTLLPEPFTKEETRSSLAADGRLREGAARDSRSRARYVVSGQHFAVDQ